MSTSNDLIANRRVQSWARRHGLLLVAISPVVANLIGSLFNILYNAYQIEPLLSAGQHERFHGCWQVLNLTVYPVAVGCWVAPLWRLRSLHRRLLDGLEIPQEALQVAQRYVINLPWWILTVAAAGWLVCVPVFPLVMGRPDDPLPSVVIWHLAASFGTGGLIAVTHSFFAVELVSQQTLFPVFFRRENPAEVPGAVPLSITGRGILWALSAVVCPVVSLVLLLLIPDAQRATPWFGIGVGGVAILYGMTTAWMLARLVALPVQALRDASMRVSDGQLDVRVNLLRADDFGHLIDRFNRMVQGLRERERLEQTFGRHVGHEAARQILAQGDGLGGSEQEVTVMFVDVRNFTAHSANHSPTEVISALNIFFRDAVDTIEQQGGMVNKFLGDGLMALFGVGPGAENHAQQAVDAAQAMLGCLDDAREELERAGWPGLAIGIGINSGLAIVGSIGSPRRQEYTAIGDTVNVAARVEALTKQVGRMLLITEATRERLTGETEVESLPAQQVKGKGEAVRIYAVVAGR